MDSFFSWDQDWHYLFLSLDNRISIIIRSMHLDFVFYFPILFWSVRHIVWFSTLSCVVEALHLSITLFLQNISYMPHVSLRSSSCPMFPSHLSYKTSMSHVSQGSSLTKWLCWCHLVFMFIFVWLNFIVGFSSLIL